jgi:hypothetical protein
LKSKFCQADDVIFVQKRDQKEQIHAEKIVRHDFFCHAAVITLAVKILPVPADSLFARVHPKFNSETLFEGRKKVFGDWLISMEDLIILQI